MTSNSTTWPKPADVSQNTHEDVCLACQRIPGLTYDVAVPIVQSVSSWRYAGMETFLRYVRDIFWSSPEYKEYLRVMDERCDLELTAKEACESIPKLEQQQPEEPWKKGPKSGYNRGSGIGERCWYREMRSSHAPAKVRNWTPGWLRQWSTQCVAVNDPWFAPTAIVEDDATGECLVVWVEDLKFERQ